jgi:hypothetical protein
MKNIGGIYITQRTMGEEGQRYEPVPVARQQEAMLFLNTHVFKSPVWLLEKEIMQKSGKQPLDIISNIQFGALQGCMSPQLLERLAKASTLATGPVYSLTDHVNTLRKYIWTELDDKRAIDPYRRNLQKIYIEKLRTLLSAPGASLLPVAASYTSDVRSVIRAHAKQLGHDIKTRLQTSSDTMTRYHLEDLLSRIDEILHPK